MVSAAYRLIGTPYRYRGRSKRGVDCVGLVSLALLEATGKELSLPAYSETPTSNEVFASLASYADRIKGEDAKPGDLLLMSWAGRSTHFGIYTGYSIIHVSRIAGKVVERDAQKARQYNGVGFYRLKALEEGGAPSSSP